MRRHAFSYSRKYSLYRIQVDRGTPESVSLHLLGVDDEMANTMLAIEDGNERLRTLRPEPAMVDFIEDIAEDEAYVLQTGNNIGKIVVLDDDEVERFEQMAEELERAVGEEGRIN